MLAGLVDKEKRGEVQGLIHIVKTAEGTAFGVNGEYSEDLRFAGYSIIKSLNTLADKIAASGISGYTADGPIRHEWPAIKPRRRELPRRMHESTGFGEL